MFLSTSARGWWNMGVQSFTYSTRAWFVLKVVLATLFVCGVMAAPAFAQGTDNEGTDMEGTEIEGTDNGGTDDAVHAGDAKGALLNCVQVQVVVANQYNSGDAIAISQYGDAIAAIAQILGISQNQVQNCLVNIGNGGDPGGGAVPPGKTTPGATTPGVTTPGATTPGATTPGVTTPGGKTVPSGNVGKPGAIVPGTESKIPLPNTGGMTPLSGMGLGIVAIAAGILSAVAIVRRGR